MYNIFYKIEKCGKTIFIKKRKKSTLQIYLSNNEYYNRGLKRGKWWDTVTEKKTNNISKEKPGTITDINKNGITVSTKDYDIILKNIKLEGKNRCDVKDFINGIKKENFIGGIFNE